VNLKRRRRWPSAAASVRNNGFVVLTVKLRLMTASKVWLTAARIPTRAATSSMVVEAKKVTLWMRWPIRMASMTRSAWRPSRPGGPAPYAGSARAPAGAPNRRSGCSQPTAGRTKPARRRARASRAGNHPTSRRAGLDKRARRHGPTRPQPHSTLWEIMERAKRFELSTPTLARLCSTPELRPRSSFSADPRASGGAIIRIGRPFARLLPDD
jgi:hypothetical protein